MKKCLQPIWADRTYITCGRRYRTVEVRFKREEIARQHSSQAPQREQTVLFPICTGRKTLKIKVANIPPEVDTAWLMSTIIKVLEVKK